MARRTFKDFYSGHTPTGTFVFPNLTEPSFKFAEYGEYAVQLDLTGAEADKLKALILEHYENEYRLECEDKGKQIARYNGMPFGPALDRDKNEIPGVTRFRFKRKAGGRYGPAHPKAGQVWSASFPIFGAAGDASVTEPIWGGSAGRIAFSIVPWFTNALGFGVRLQIEAVKVIKLVSQGEKAASAYGFEDEEGYIPAPPTTGTGGSDELGTEESAGSVDF